MRRRGSPVKREERSERAGCVWRQHSRWRVVASTKVTGDSRDGGGGREKRE